MKDTSYSRLFKREYCDIPGHLVKHLDSLEASGIQLLHAGVTRYNSDQLERYTTYLTSKALCVKGISDMSPMYSKLMHDLNNLSAKVWNDGNIIEYVAWWYIGQPGQPDADSEDMSLYSFVSFLG